MCDATSPVSFLFLYHTFIIQLLRKHLGDNKNYYLVLFYIFKFSSLSFFFFFFSPKRELQRRDRERTSSIHFLTLSNGHHGDSRAELTWSQVPGTYFDPPVWVQVPKDLSHPTLLSQAIGKELVMKQSNQSTNGHTYRCQHLKVEDESVESSQQPLLLWFLMLY